MARGARLGRTDGSLSQLHGVMSDCIGPITGGVEVITADETL